MTQPYGSMDELIKSGKDSVSDATATFLKWVANDISEPGSDQGRIHMAAFDFYLRCVTTDGFRKDGIQEIKNFCCGDNSVLLTYLTLGWYLYEQMHAATPTLQEVE